MTIDEAIEILTIMKEGEPLYPKYDTLAALQLGIEALETIKDIRDGREAAVYSLLPGETK